MPDQLTEFGLVNNFLRQPQKEVGNLTTQRTKQENLSLYAEGWANGDAEKVVQAVAPSYQ